jgi:hypothetical protein
VTDAAGTHPATVAEETGYGLVGIGGESRSGDANGEYVRVEAGGGVNTPVLPGPIGSTAGKVIENSQPASETVPFVGFAESQLLGSQPNLALGHEDSVKTPFRPDAPCERQQPPNLQVSNGPAPQQVTPTAPSASSSSPQLEQLNNASTDWAGAYGKAQKLAADGHQAKADGLVAKATKQWLHAKAKVDPQLRAQLKATQKQEGSR